jgi:hypothetical protein
VFFEFGRTRLQLLRIIFYFFSLLGEEEEEEKVTFGANASKTTYDNITISLRTTCKVYIKSIIFTSQLIRTSSIYLYFIFHSRSFTVNPYLLVASKNGFWPIKKISEFSFFFRHWLRWLSPCSTQQLGWLWTLHSDKQTIEHHALLRKVKTIVFFVLWNWCTGRQTTTQTNSQKSETSRTMIRGPFFSHAPDCFLSSSRIVRTITRANYKKWLIFVILLARAVEKKKNSDSLFFNNIIIFHSFIHSFIIKYYFWNNKHLQSTNY